MSCHVFKEVNKISQIFGNYCILGIDIGKGCQNVPKSDYEGHFSINIVIFLIFFHEEFQITLFVIEIQFSKMSTKF
jgi:hypothetical protein